MSDLEEIAKVKRRIPKWRENPDQINHKILDAYLRLSKDNDNITVEELRRYCNENYKLSRKQFNGNYSDMRNKRKKNHAKVFEQTSDLIKLWDPVAEFIKQEWKRR